MICPCTFQSIHSNQWPRLRIISLSFQFSQFMIEFTPTSPSDITYFISKRHRFILRHNGALWVYIDLASCFFIIAYSPRVLKFLFRPFVISLWAKLVNTLPRKLGPLGKGEAVIWINILRQRSRTLKTWAKSLPGKNILYSSLNFKY